MTPRPVIRFPEIGAATQAIGSVLAGEAGEAEGFPPGYRAKAEAIHAKLSNVPRGGVLIAFSHKELELLWHALGNGAGDDTMHHLGLRSDEKRILADACNRVADAGRFAGPRF